MIFTPFAHNPDSLIRVLLSKEHANVLFDRISDYHIYKIITRLCFRMGFLAFQTLKL